MRKEFLARHLRATIALMIILLIFCWELHNLMHEKQTAFTRLQKNATSDFQLINTFSQTAKIEVVSSKTSVSASSEIQKTKYTRHQAAEEFRMARDLLSGPQIKQFNPGEIPTTAHYVWCGDKIFTFGDYLGVLSIVRILDPLRIFFYYNSLPQTDGSFYHSWFPELKQSVANLVFKKIDRPINCNTMDAVDFALEQMASNKVGGVYVGERAVLTHVPDSWKTGKYFTYQKQGSSSSEDMIVFVKEGINGKNEFDIKQFKHIVLSQSNECCSPEQYDNIDHTLNTTANIASPCVVMSGPIYPENILNSSSSFSAVLRWLYYGRSDGLYAKQSQDSSDLVPLINHRIFLNPHPGSPVEWNFEKYINILSALYLGGFERVYVHGDTEPSGKFWDKLKTENVTFVYIDQPYSVFQQDVNVMEHKSDILRIQILYKYGGTYTDTDIFWLKPLTEDQRRYPSVACYEYTSDNIWPRTINSGLIVSKPRAPFLIKVLESFWYYRDDLWAMNVVYMFYKIYERNPECLHIDTKLQVCCYQGICHPAWHPDYRRGFSDPRPTTRFNIDDAFAYHFFHHGSPSKFTSFSDLQNKSGIEAVLAKRVMAAILKAGRAHLLKDD